MSSANALADKARKANGFMEDRTMLRFVFPAVAIIGPAIGEVALEDTPRWVAVYIVMLVLSEIYFDQRIKRLKKVRLSKG